MEDAPCVTPAVPTLCALVSGRKPRNVRVWGLWSKLRWYLLG